MSLCSGYISIVVLAFYINSPEVIVLYSNPNYLWVFVVLYFWITMIILVANRGNMHHDPIIYASTDKVSYFCLFLIFFFNRGNILNEFEGMGWFPKLKTSLHLPDKIAEIQ